MLLAGCARFVCSWFYGWLVDWTVKWLVETFISKYHYHLTLQLACICFKPRFHIRTLVDRIHANSVAPVRQDLQTKVTNAFAHLNTGAPIVRKETVGKKTFFIWWNIFVKISTSPFKLSIDESVYGLYVWAAAKILKVHWRRDCQNCCSWVFITSILDSWNSLLYGLPQQDYNSFKIQQLELLHILGNYWLPVRNCMVYTILSLVYKAVSGAVPCNISDSLDYRTSKRTLRSSL